MMEIDPKSHIIFDKALKNIVFDGWNNSMLEAAAKEAGLKPEEAYIYFPQGIECLVDYFEKKNLMDLENRAKDMNPSFRLHEKIKFLLETYFEIIEKNKAVMVKLSSYYMIPGNQFQAIKNLYNLVDGIWKIAGDNPTDFSYYTKRLTLASIISQSFLFWLSDNSESSVDTKQFIGRRLKDVMLFGKTKEKVKSIFKSLDLRPALNQIRKYFS